MPDNTDAPYRGKENIPPNSKKMFVLEIEYNDDDQELARLLLEAGLYVARNGCSPVQVRNRQGHRVGVGRVSLNHMLPSAFLGVRKVDVQDAAEAAEEATKLLHRMLGLKNRGEGETDA